MELIIYFLFDTSYRPEILFLRQKLPMRAIAAAAEEFAVVWGRRSCTSATLLLLLSQSLALET